MTNSIIARKSTAVDVGLKMLERRPKFEKNHSNVM
jgi:hypothetical protein